MIRFKAAATPVTSSTDVTTITIPAGVVDGDIIIVATVCPQRNLGEVSGSTSTSWGTAPTGGTSFVESIYTTVGPYVLVDIWRATGAEAGGTVTVTLRDVILSPPYGTNCSVAVVYSGANPVKSTYTLGVNSDTASGSYSPSVTDHPSGPFASYRNDLLVDVWANAAISVPLTATSGTQRTAVNASTGAYPTGLMISDSPPTAGSTITHTTSQGGMSAPWVAGTIGLPGYEGAPPTRQFPRDDNLAVGSVRQAGSSSLQNSIRQGSQGTYT